VVRPNSRGRIPWHENLRSAISRWFFEDRLTPMTQAELDAATEHQHHALHEMEEQEAAELQGAHERAGHGDSPLYLAEAELHDEKRPETGNRPSNLPAGSAKDDDASS